MARSDGSRDAGRPTLLERAGSAAAALGGGNAGSPRGRLAIQWGLAALIFGFLVLFVVHQWSEIPDDFRWRFAPGWLALSILAVLAFYTCQSAIWRRIVHALGQELQPRPSRAIWAKSLIARYVPTNALMVVGRVVMAGREGVPRRVCLASIAYELGLLFGTAVMIGAYFVIELPDLEEQPARYAVLVLVPLVLAALHPRVFAPVAAWALSKLGREPLPRALSFGAVLRFSLAYVGAWALIGFSVYAFARALTPVGLSDLGFVAAAYPVAFCVAVLTFVLPSGLGTRDAALAVAMTAVLPDTVATAIAVGFRLFQTALELLFVGAAVTIARGRAPNPRLPSRGSDPVEG